jgi:hypothetical protein
LLLASKLIFKGSLAAIQSGYHAPHRTKDRAPMDLFVDVPVTLLRPAS